MKKIKFRSGIPRHELEALAACLMPDILAFYESEEGQREFSEWKAAQEQKISEKGANHHE